MKLPMTTFYSFIGCFFETLAEVLKPFSVVNDLPLTAKSSTHLGLEFYSQFFTLSRAFSG
jgi:hypothetical protein